MRTILSILITLLLTFCLLLSSQAQPDIIDAVNRFYFEAHVRHQQIQVRHVEVRVAIISNANGKITRLKDDNLLLVIDHDFYNFYFQRSQVKRLVFFLLAHELLGLEKSKHGIMNEEKVYRKLMSRDIDRLFRSGINQRN